MIPRSAVDHYRLAQREQAGAALYARRAWRNVSPAHISESLTEVLPALSRAVAGAQYRVAADGATYGASALAEQGGYVSPDEWVNPAGLAGISSRGAPLEAALYSAAPYTKSLIADGVTVSAAMAAGGKLLEKAVSTQVTDAGRIASGLDTFTRKGVAYTRMINPGACSRCVILAGRIYRNNEGFLRHPGCACIHVATNVEAAEREGLITDPYQHFESLSEAGQDRIYTRAGAQAIRDGGDMFQVVNSRRGMSYAGVSSDGSRRGQRALASTTEGTTRRGYFGGMQDRSTLRKGAGDRYSRTRTERLTPDAIYAQKLPREQTLELLRTNGYLLSQGQVATGAIRGMGSALNTGRLTAAQSRLERATFEWRAVQQGRNPYGRWELTDQDRATAEKNYRRWLASDGQIYTR